MKVLSATFFGRWIGRGGSILCPSRGPDLTPFDYFFRDYVNSYIYKDKSSESRNKRRL
jgi:hypothetical protein